MSPDARLPLARRNAARRKVALSPAVGVVRRASPATFGAVGYTGARSDRRELRDWSPGLGTADQDTLVGRDQLVARSADLARNDALAAGALNTQTTKVIGVGLSPQPRLDGEYLGLAKEQARAFEVQALRIWWAVAGTTSLDLSDRVTFRGLTEQVFRGALERGDCLALRRFKRRPGQLLGLKVELIEGDRISNPFDGADTALRRAGIDFDADGAPLRYHVKSADPTTSPYGLFGFASAASWTAVAARGASTGERQALHVFHQTRPGQTRGVPYLAPVILALKQLGRYSEAELMAAVVSAAFTVFIKTEDSGATGDKDLRIDAGLISRLGFGESIETAHPGRPNPAFEPFFSAISQEIGVALEIPSEILLKKFDASYTAARAALLELWEAIIVRRNWLIESWCQPVYEWALTEAVLAGLLDAPGFFDDPLARRAYCAAQWTGPKQGQLDPYKEIVAAEKRVALTVSNLQRETAEMTGEDWDEMVAQRAHERAELARLAVPDAATAALAAPAPTDPGPNAPNDPAGDPNGPLSPPPDPADLPTLVGAA